MHVAKKVGLLTAKYETSGKGPGYISNGSSWGDPEVIATAHIN